MEATFYINNVYAIAEKIQLVVEGELESGEILPGMNLNISLNKALDVVVSISLIEVIKNDLKKLRLSIQCEDNDEVELLIGLNLANDTYKITENNKKQ